jgi:ATP-binding cassette subfamily C protein LapB
MKELLSRLLAHPVILTELIAASLLANLLALASPLFVIQVLNRYVAHGVDTTLATLTAGVLLAILLELGFRQVRLRLAGAVNAPYDEGLSEGAFGILTGSKTAAIESLPEALRLEVISATDSIRAAATPANVAALLDVPFALVFIVALYLLSPPLAVMAGGILAVVFVVALISLLSLRGTARDALLAGGRRRQLVASAVATGEAVRSFNRASFLKRRWLNESEAFLNLERRVAARHGLIQSLTQSAQALLGVAVIAVGAVLVVKGELDVGALIGANILASRALGPLVRFAQMGDGFAKARQGLGLVREFAKLPLERKEGTGLVDFRGSIEFKDLAFAYPGARTPLFESLNLKLEPGAVLVVAGANGVGKTTLAQLLVGLLEPSRGQILVDGVDLTQIAPEWWRCQLVYLPQEPRFLDASLRDNMAGADGAPDEAELQRVIRAAGLKSFIDQNPGGLDQQVTGNGANLSLGIRRRLALARALAGGGMLGIFDEPTEGLDREGADHVYAAMNELVRNGRTVIAFSHDPYVLKGAQSVLDLNAKPVPKLLKRAPQDTKEAAH